MLDDVAVHGVLAEDEALGDLAVGEAVGQQADDLLLAPGERAGRRRIAPATIRSASAGARRRPAAGRVRSPSAKRARRARRAASPPRRETAPRRSGRGRCRPPRARPAAAPCSVATAALGASAAATADQAGHRRGGLGAVADATAALERVAEQRSRGRELAAGEHRLPEVVRRARDAARVADRAPQRERALVERALPRRGRRRPARRSAEVVAGHRDARVVAEALAQREALAVARDGRAAVPPWPSASMYSARASVSGAPPARAAASAARPGPRGGSSSPW